MFASFSLPFSPTSILNSATKTTTANNGIPSKIEVFYASAVQSVRLQKFLTCALGELLFRTSGTTKPISTRAANKGQHNSLSLKVRVFTKFFIFYMPPKDSALPVGRQLILQKKKGGDWRERVFLLPLGGLHKGLCSLYKIY
jgi:hypothetical protein